MSHLPSRRKTAPKVKRYWPGKVPEGVQLEATSSESEPESIATESHPRTTTKPSAAAVHGSESDVGEWAIESESESDEDQTVLPPKSPTSVSRFSKKLTVTKVHADLIGHATPLSPTRPAAVVSPPTELIPSSEAQPAAEHRETERESFSESSATTSSSESEAEPTRPVLLKPVFIPKSRRGAMVTSTEESKPSADLVSPARTDRQNDTRKLIEEKIKAEQQERAQVPADLDAVDDADGLDPDAEFEEWKVREMARIKRNLEERLERERELQEIERIRNMDERDRRREDAQRIREQQEEKRAKYQERSVQQRAQRKGAFYSDTFGATLTPVAEGSTDPHRQHWEQLPDIMRVKNFGRASQGKWKSLKHEDTSQRDSLWNQSRGRSDRYQSASGRTSRSDRHYRPR
ncbi:hypothetical protein IWQ62_005157 [Dispira parvispora]|uniref:Micro-fibrillar-associated protein 1 C-terminal domain-containing protein n=1 Tax=Dispira parvispora TaxID=1520584 RepID=A0A9W8AQY8_9FUNG|nr:hypothetical protein IWQ62_005157 [Dispira parvispora]